MLSYCCVWLLMSSAGVPVSASGGVLRINTVVMFYGCFHRYDSDRGV